MNGVHDMGGMHGFGSVPDDDAIFHADWEKAAYATNKLLRLQGVYNIHEYRHSVERMEPAAYLGATYFERWLAGVEGLTTEKDVLDPAEIEQRLEEIRDGECDPAVMNSDAGNTDGLRKRAAASFRSGAEPAPRAADPAYEVGDSVRVRNSHPAGHTRVPRYARGAVGTVTELLGQLTLPDAAAAGTEESGPVYVVDFDAEELWGEDTDADSVALDMWERYLTEV